MNETIGSLLKETREALGFTLDQVAMETKIQKRYLIDLETENFEDMPGTVYEKGFLKNYANLLGLDMERVMELYEKSRLAFEEKDGDDDLSSLEEKNISPRLSARKKTFIIILLLLISYILYSFFYTRLLVGNKQSKLVESFEKINYEENILKEELISEKLEEKEKPIKNNSMLSKEENNELIDEKEHYLYEKEIQLVVNGKSWVEVYKNQERLFYNLARSGTINIKGNKNDNIFIKVGDASKIELIYNGENQGLMGKERQVVRKNF